MYKKKKWNETRRGCARASRVCVRVSWECYVAGPGISGYNIYNIYIIYMYMYMYINGSRAAREGYCAKNI